MNLQYEGREDIPADPAAVWAFVNDPEKVGHCLPEVIQVTVRDPTHFDAIVGVGLGPVRGKFTFKFELQPDETARRMNMKIAGGGLGSAVDLTAGAEIVQAGPGTTLNWSGSAVMRGPVAAVGGRVLDAQAKKLIAQTFANVRAKLSS
ncbi:MAG TPA: carbon monoxide dehydrogenase subunit G [Vicinamibacterales bacterium]|nr:carbon monoxide dehydrogenase subunit G [Vicinamibacterales bacterium]